MKIERHTAHRVYSTPSRMLVTSIAEPYWKPKSACIRIHALRDNLSITRTETARQLRIMRKEAIA